jgi:acyl carrier protein
MNEHRRSEVALSLARYVGAAPGEALARRELRRDLGLEPLDLVLFVLDLEESDRIAFRVEELADTVTAGDLIKTVSGWLEDHDRDERLADEQDEFSEERPTA